jgi:hypothetical protein
MELYQPIKIQTQGEKSANYGVGILTKSGAYLTGQVPPMSRVSVTSFLPKNTIFKTMDGVEHVLHVPEAITLGTKKVPVKPTIYRRSHFAIDPPRPSSISMNLAKAAQAEFDIVIEEVERGKFKIYAKTPTGVYIQPLSGWVWLNG